MNTIETKNAVIKDARIFIEDHGMLTAYIYLDYGGTSQGFGGYSLYLPKSFKFHTLNSFAGHFIYRVLEIVDVERWDQLTGKTIRVKADWNKIISIGHIVKDIWFDPKEEFKEASNENS